jgi:serine/threonine protein kinase
MGAVYKALQIQMRRYVAVKILPKKFAEDPMYVERFRREARAAAALNHPNIVLPISVGEEMGYHYLAMEFVDGESLGSWMEREGRLRWKEAIEIAIQVARGLEHAHKHKLIHRDIKPDNILLDRPSRLAKIVDLGLARRTTDRSDITNAAGNPVGTAYYVSPEQARGEGNLDGRTDIYSLGASLWHMLVGVPPFDGPNAAVILTKHITEPVPDPRTSVSDCPEGLVQLILKAMAKKREDRYEDCTQLCEDMQALLDGRRPRYAHAARGAGAARGVPLVVPTGGLAPGARLRDPSSSRLKDPTTSRLRGPTASRLRGPGTSRAPEITAPRETSPFQTKKKPSPWLNIVILAGLLIVCLILIIVLAQRKAEQPPPDEPKKESVKR